MSDAHAARRVLVAGIGNIFLGDDGFGPAVASELAKRKMLPAEATVTDFGIRGLDLAYTLLDGWDAVVLVDITRRGGPPGTLYVLEPEPGGLPPDDAPAMDMHGMHPARVLAVVEAMGGEVRWMRLVGCEPDSLGGEDGMEMKLSDPVQAAIEPAIEAVQLLVAEYLDAQPRARHQQARHA
jgi:hydrogenase maturation protease